jgi:hypothetical protein
VFDPFTHAKYNEKSYINSSPLDPVAEDLSVRPLNPFPSSCKMKVSAQKLGLDSPLIIQLSVLYFFTFNDASYQLFQVSGTEPAAV